MSVPSVPPVSSSRRPRRCPPVAAFGALLLVSSALVSVALPVPAIGSGGAKTTPVSKKRAAPPKPTVKPAVTPSPRAALKVPPGKAVAVAAAAKPAPLAASYSKSAPTPVATHWESAYVEVLKDGRGRINYEAGIAKAVGLGAVAPPSLARSQAQRVLDARSAALADALRTLSIAVSEVRVTADTRARNYILSSDDVRVAVKGVVNSAEVIEEKLVPGTGLFRVVVQIPLSGEGSLAQALGLEKPAAEMIAVEAPEPKANPLAPGAPAPDGAEYTSLIVDCRGLGVEACMSPRLLDEDGREVYGKVMVSADYAIETGIVAFPRSVDDAMNCSRAGRRPLVVRARGVADRNRFNPYISERDARRIADANRDSRFFERTAVIFLVDPVRYFRR